MNLRVIGGAKSMAELRRSNVLPFEPIGSHPRSSLSPDMARLLGLCRDGLVHGVATAFAGNLARANDDLLGMADRATSLEHQQLYFAAMEFLANRSQALLQGFRTSYLARFEIGLEALRPGRRVQYPADLGELSLVDTDDFERDLALDKLSARAVCNCTNQLTALERRIAALLQLPRIGQDDNPFYPRALFNAMLGALGALGVGEPLSLTLLQAFERQTSVELPGIYSALNQTLADGGVLPEIPVGLVRPAQRSDIDGSTARQGPEGPAIPEAAGDPGGQSPRERPPGDTLGGLVDLATTSDGLVTRLAPTVIAPGQDVFAQLLYALQATLASGSGVSPGLATGPLGPVLATGTLGYPGPLASMPGAQRLIQTLSGLQRGRVDTHDLPELGPNPIDPTGGNALRQLRSTPLVNGSHPMDAMTVDIVSLLFEAIFRDPDLSAALRTEIAKLQIPVLKVALMNKAFFSNAQDPARRLLDGIAGAGIGCDALEEGRLMDKVRVIVDELVTGFDTDVDIFERQVNALETFLEEEAAAAAARTHQAVMTLEAEEREALARARVETEIRNRLQQRTVPPLVAQFLDQHWRLVLAKAHEQGGEEGTGWRHAIATMDDLIWSVGPQRRAEDRSRLLATLPGLLKGLRGDLAALGDEDAWDPFFAQLIRLHVASLRAGCDGVETPDQGSGSCLTEPMAARPVYTTANLRTLAQVDAAATNPVSAQQGAKGESGVLPVAVPPDTGTDDRHLELARSLKVGTWVELESARGTRKALRLSWVSELRGALLFTNRQGENAITLAATSLAEHLRKGTARVLSQDRLTDRAVAQMLRKTVEGSPALAR